jgi:hypothetical protein
MSCKLSLFWNEIMFHMLFVIEGSSAPVNETGEGQPLKAGNFHQVNPGGI